MPAMSFLHEHGDLAATPLAALLIEALNTKASGILTVQHGAGTSRLYLRTGMPVGAQVFTGFKPLGQVLLQAGLIDMPALDRSLAEMARTGKPQGRLLVEMGAIPQEVLDRALGEQQAGYVAAIAALDAGAYAFDAGASIPEWTRGIHISPLKMIVDALEKAAANSLVVSAIGHAGAGTIALTPGYPQVEAHFGWSGAEKALVDRLSTPILVDTFFAAGGVAPERARAVLAALFLLGLAEPATAPPGTVPETPIGLTVDLADIAAPPEEVAELSPAEAAAARDAPPRPAVAAPVPRVVEPSSPPPPPRPAPPPAAAAVRPSAPPPATASALPRAAAPSSPAPPSAPPPAAAPQAHRSDPEESRQRRQRLLARAMQNMGVGPLGGRPAGGPATPSPSEPWPTPAPVVPDLPTPAPAKGPRPDATALEATLRRSLEFVAPRTRTRDLFARLGIPRTASRDEVKQAYLSLAKQFHPDRFLSPALSDLTTVVKELFAALNEAYEVLSDNKKRAEYLSLSGGTGGAATAQATGSTPELAGAAKIDFQKGEACVRTRDYGKARGFLEAAIRSHPRAEYRAALAWAILSDPHAKDRQRVKELLEEAMNDPTCDRAFYLSGLVAREAKDEARAEKMFRAAYRANPDNPDAQREVRAADARRRAKGEDRSVLKK